MMIMTMMMILVIMMEEKKRKKEKGKKKGRGRREKGKKEGREKEGNEQLAGWMDRYMELGIIPNYKATHGKTESITSSEGKCKSRTK